MTFWADQIALYPIGQYWGRGSEKRPFNWSVCDIPYWPVLGMREWETTFLTGQFAYTI